VLLCTDYRIDWMGEGREERGATPLTCCVGLRSSGQGPPLIPWGEAHIQIIGDMKGGKTLPPPPLPKGGGGGGVGVGENSGRQSAPIRLSLQSQSDRSSDSDYSDYCA
jgi:hypothetical protein